MTLNWLDLVKTTSPVRAMDRLKVYVSSSLYYTKDCDFIINFWYLYSDTRHCNDCFVMMQRCQVSRQYNTVKYPISNEKCVMCVIMLGYWRVVCSIGCVLLWRYTAWVKDGIRIHDSQLGWHDLKVISPGLNIGSPILTKENDSCLQINTPHTYDRPTLNTILCDTVGT